MDGPEVNSRCFKTALLIAICCLSAAAAQNDSISSTTTATSSTVTSTTLPTTTETILASTSTHEPSSSPTSTSSATTPTTMTSTTETVKKVNTSCSSTSECVNGAECNDAICTCGGEFYVTTDGQCKSKLTLGANCEEDTQCTDNAECQNATCVCTRDYYPVNDKCLRQVGLGENCTSSRECTDRNTRCDDVKKICTCRNYHFNDGDICLEVESQAERLTVRNVTTTSVVVSFYEPQEENRHVFRLEISNMTDNDYFCIALYRNSTKDNLCKSTTNEKPKECKRFPLSDNEKHIEHNVTNLKFNTNYSITVVMITCENGTARQSDPATKNVTTKPAVPGIVKILNVTSTGTHVCVTWSAPSPYPGPLEYSVALVDNVTNDNETVTIIQDSGSNITYCHDELKLVGYWEYKFAVSAFTSSGRGPKISSKSFITGKRKPNVSFKIIDADETRRCRNFPRRDYRKILISWKDPDPKDRGTRLSRYDITVTVANHTSIAFKEVNRTLTTVGDGRYRRTASSREPYCISLSVEPGEDYSIKFETYDASDKSYPETVIVDTAPIGKPPAWNTTLRPSVTDIKEKSFIIHFHKPPFFTDATNGPVTANGLIVSTSTTLLLERVPTGERAQQISTTWRDKTGIYRVNINRLSADGRVTLGSDGDCSKVPQIQFCNGELKPKTTYYVVVFVCTHRGCEKSSILEFTTIVDNTVTIAIALVGVALFVGVTVVVAAFLWRFRKSEHLPLTLSMRTKVDLSKIPRERPITLASMDAMVSEMHSDSNRLFSMHYEDIVRVSPKHSTHAANVDENKQKNRWVNVLPFDDSRVTLSIIDNEETSDYVNASYMPGYNWDKEYVASQGPLPGTVDDFWRMIWEQNVSMIVMVTPIKENGKVKCEEYWPVEVHEPKEYGNIVVENISFSSLNTYNVTIFQLRMGDEEEFRTVKHFHFLNWKDMSANVERSDVLNFVRTVRSYLRPDMEGPMIVHCSAGVGRTGTFICLDYLIQFIENHDLDETVDIYAYILKLRENRVLMVQTESQYVFLHDCANQLVEEKRQAMDNISENELLYVNTEIVASQSEDDEEKRLIYENTECASTSRLIQQTEL